MLLAPDDARQWFAAARVARLATVTPTGAPHLVPVTFVVLRSAQGDTVWHVVDDKPKSTRSLRRLAHVAAEPRVSLLVDHYADDWSHLWWVRADGRASVLPIEVGSGSAGGGERANAAGSADAADAGDAGDAGDAANEADAGDVAGSSGAEEAREALAALTARCPAYVINPPPGPLARVEVTRWSGWSAS